MSDCVEIQLLEASLPIKWLVIADKSELSPLLLTKCAEAAVARNVTPHKTSARDRTQNKINGRY